MTIGYIDATLGAAGDMLVAAMLDAGLSLAGLRKELRKVRLAGYSVSEKLEEREDPRIGHHRPARRFIVRLSKKEHGRSLREITSLVKTSGLEAPDKEKALAVFARLAAAETKVHGGLPDHFHQVGETDSIVDIIAAVAGLRLLGVEKLYCSAVNLGSPAPATSIILKGFPVIVNAGQPEGCTPTAAAVLAELADFSAAPEFRLLASGAGAGSRREPPPNVLSLFLGETSAPAHGDRVMVVETNLDDMPPTAFDRLFQKLQKAGCLDFILTPGLMKKGRPGQKLEVIARKEDLDKVLDALFRESSTFGARIAESDRVVLERRFEEVTVRGRRVRIKIGRRRGGIVKAAPEYEDVKKIADEEDLPLMQVMDEARDAYRERQGSDSSDPRA